MCFTKSSGRCLPPRRLISSLLWQECSRGWAYLSEIPCQCAASSHCLRWGWAVRPTAVCQEGDSPPRGILCTLNEPWPTPQPFFLPCRNSFPRSTRGLTHQTLFIWDPKRAITEAELRIAPTRGLFHIYCVFSYLYRKCYLITSVYLSHWKGKLHERVESQLQRKQQKPAEVRGNMTSQKGPCGNIPCSSRGRHHEETW